jgi:ATP/maltotriose-dependent transcriptional regulator MalT
VRDDRVSSASVVQFWKDEHLRRVDIGPLHRDELDLLTSEMIGRPAPVRLTDRIWELTRGNPLFTRELLLGMVGSADVALTDEAIAGQLSDSTRLRDVVGRRLHDLPTDRRVVVDAVSLAEPLDADVAVELFGAPALESVERRTLVRIEATDEGHAYRTSHPLLGELLRADLSPTARQVLLRRITDAMLRRSTDSTTELRVASWLVDAGMDVEPELATNAARTAMRVFDGLLAERLSSAAVAHEPTVGRLLTHGEALSMIGRVDEAEAAFLAAEALAPSEVELGTTSVLRAVNLLHRGGRPDAAMALLRRRTRELVDPRARANIESMLMQGEGVQGDFSRALDVGPGLAAEVRTRDIAELRVLVSLVVARVVTGRLANVEAELQRGLEIAHELADIHPVEADQMLLNELLYELTRPDVGAAARLTVDRLAGTAGAGEGPWFYMAGWMLSSIGDIDAARRAATAGLERLATVDPIGLRPLAAGVHAMVHAQAGDLEQARASLDMVIDDPRSAQPRSRMFLGRAETWLIANERDPAEAASRAAEIGASLRDAWHQTWGAWGAYDAVRLGHAEFVVDLLEGIALESNDGAVHLFADHARALARHDAGALGDIATRFERCGMRAHAAEAHAHAASVGSEPSTARHRQRAIVLRDRCPGLMSPVLDSLEGPLSERELEIGRHAAAGVSSRDIAEALFISRRTVDNHLGSVYSKLGLDGRAELADLFAVTHSAADDYSILP